MKISTKGRYALRMMIEFGMNPDTCTKISQVAANPVSYTHLDVYKRQSSSCRIHFHTAVRETPRLSHNS